VRVAFSHDSSFTVHLSSFQHSSAGSAGKISLSACLIFRLICPAMNLSPDQIQSIGQHLAPLRPVVVYLFGSAAAGQLRPDSDVDLAFLSRQSIPPEEVFQARLRLAEALGSDVDLVDLARATAVLRKEVLATGRVLLETDPQRRAEFEMYALSDYARLNEERAPVLDALGQPLVAHA
jgi:predicted nucleotidyltransferase